MRLWLRPSFAGMLGAMPWFARRPWRQRGRVATPAGAGACRQRLVGRAAARLRLDEAQQARLTDLVACLDAQRQALRGAGDWRADLQALVQDESFDRWHAEDLVNARRQAVREHAPRVIAALAAFYDGLQPSQQQRVRELLQRWSTHG